MCTHFFVYSKKVQKRINRSLSLKKKAIATVTEYGTPYAEPYALPKSGTVQYKKGGDKEHYHPVLSLERP